MSRKIPYFSPKYALFPRYTPPPTLQPIHSPFNRFFFPFVQPFYTSCSAHVPVCIIRCHSPALFSMQSIFHRRLRRRLHRVRFRHRWAQVRSSRVDPCHAARAAVASRSKKQVAKGEGNGLQETKTCTGRKQKAGRKGKGARRWNAADRKGAEPEEQNALPRRGAERK